MTQPKPEPLCAECGLTREGHNQRNVKKLQVDLRRDAHPFITAADLQKFARLKRRLGR